MLPVLLVLASFFSKFKGLAFPLVEAFGVGQVNVGTGDAVEGRHGVPGACAGANSFGVYDRDANVADWHVGSSALVSVQVNRFCAIVGLLAAC